MHMPATRLIHVSAPVRAVTIIGRTDRNSLILGDMQSNPSAAERAQAWNSIRRLLEPRKVVVASNREPYRAVERDDGSPVMVRTDGGLVTALDAAMRQCGGAWVAWEPPAEPASSLAVGQADLPFTFRGVPVSRREVRGYYDGLANRALWPIFHYSLEHCHFEEAQWEDYIRVNQRFADAVIEEAGADDLIWIQDYHLCLVPAAIRARTDRYGPLAYFHHIPFPAPEFFETLPWCREILRGLLGADLIGLHTEVYVRNFLASCAVLLGLNVDEAAGEVEVAGRRVRVKAFPIGIDADKFAKLAADPQTRLRAQAIRAEIAAPRLLLSVDRLDYSKGIPERLAAYEQLLATHPELLGHVTLVQIVVPSRTRVPDYQALKQRIEEAVARINARFSSSVWQPIRHHYGKVSRPWLAAYYRAADTMVVTPIRDGMNLVAKEFCACRVEEDGVLVLSAFAGAAEQLGAGAVLVNPLSPAATSAALWQALNMPLWQQRRRMREMRDNVFTYDVRRWMQQFLAAAIDRRFVGMPCKVLA